MGRIRLFRFCKLHAVPNLICLGFYDSLLQQQETFIYVEARICGDADFSLTGGMLVENMELYVYSYSNEN